MEQTCLNIEILLYYSILLLLPPPFFPPTPKVISPVPQIQSFDLNSSWEFVVAATDGVWDAMSNQVSIANTYTAFQRFPTCGTSGSFTCHIMSYVEISKSTTVVCQPLLSGGSGMQTGKEKVWNLPILFLLILLLFSLLLLRRW